MDDKFKPRISESKEVKTYLFDEGFMECVQRIKNLSETLKRDVFVIILGSSTDVGKSYLRADLCVKLIRDGLSAYPGLPIPYIKNNEPKRVFLTDNSAFIGQENIDINFGRYRCGDFIVGIERPDKKFSPPFSSQDGDMLISNEKAKDKK